MRGLPQVRRDAFPLESCCRSLQIKAFFGSVNTALCRIFVLKRKFGRKNRGNFISWHVDDPDMENI